MNYGPLGNYNLAGFEMILHRYVSHYIITYYLPSGKTITIQTGMKKKNRKGDRSKYVQPSEHKEYKFGPLVAARPATDGYELGDAASSQ